MLIINADQVNFAAASAEVWPENGPGSEPIAKAATASVYMTLTGNGGGGGVQEQVTAAAMQWQDAPKLEGGGRLMQQGWYCSS
jgi:hypothetical protein